MTRFLTVLFVLAASLIALPALACEKADAAETAADIEEPANLQYALVSVKDVSCAGCYVPIRQELTAMKGVKTIEEGTELGKLVVGFEKDSKLTDEQFKAAIKRAGYECSVQVTAEKPAGTADTPKQS